MEIASAKNILQYLEEGQITVGSKISIEHDLMVRGGEDVEIISTIQEREKRNVTFSVQARSGGKTVATASHQRVIVPASLLSRIMSR
jgi:predicted thioesterase